MNELDYYVARVKELEQEKKEHWRKISRQNGKYLIKFTERLSERDIERVDLAIAFVPEFVRNMMYVLLGAITSEAIIRAQIIPNETVEFWFTMFWITTFAMVMELFVLSLFHSWLDELSETTEEE